MKNLDVVRKVLLRKIAAEDKKIDTASALATAGGGIVGGLGGLAVGEGAGMYLGGLAKKRVFGHHPTGVSWTAFNYAGKLDDLRNEANTLKALYQSGDIGASDVQPVLNGVSHTAKVLRKYRDVQSKLRHKATEKFWKVKNKTVPVSGVLGALGGAGLMYGLTNPKMREKLGNLIG
jgi:hypothetical protein